MNSSFESSGPYVKTSSDINDYRVLSYACVIAVISYIYDYLLTLGREIELIWRRPPTFPTILYIFLRYLTLITAVVSTGPYIPSVLKALPCPVILAFLGITHICIISLITAIMSLRVVALYNGNRSMLYTLISVNIAQTVAVSFIVGNRRASVIAKEGACQSAHISFTWLTGLWWVPLVVDTVLLALTLVRIWWLRRSHQSLPSPLLQIVGRDGIVYYMVICSLYVLNVLIYLFNTANLKIAGFYIGVTAPALTVCRLTLNLQGLSSGLDSQAYVGESELGAFTTFPSELRINATRWLTGEPWGQLHGLPLSSDNNHVQGVMIRSGVA